MRITKRSPLRRMIREIEALWEGPEGFEEMSPEQLAEWLCLLAVYFDRLNYRLDVYGKRTEQLEEKIRLAQQIAGTFAEVHARLDALEQPGLFEGSKR